MVCIFLSHLFKITPASLSGIAAACPKISLYTYVFQCLYLSPTPLDLWQESGRKKKAKKDPNAPKKPLSAYMLWLQENRPLIKRENPGASLGEIGKRAGEMWKALDDKTVRFFSISLPL